MIKLKEEDQDWYNAIVGGTEWEILSSDMDEEEPKAAHIIALALDNKNKRAFSIGQVEILKALKSLCNPNPGTFRAQYDSIQAWMANGLGHDADDDRYYYAFRLVMISGGKNSETLNDVFKWADNFVDESKRQIRLESYRIFAQYPSKYPTVVKSKSK